MRDFNVGDRVVLVESDWLYDDGCEPRGVVVEVCRGYVKVRADDSELLEDGDMCEWCEENICHEDEWMV